MAEQVLQKQLVDMVSGVLKDEKPLVRELVFDLLKITMLKQKNQNVELTAKAKLESEFKKGIASGVFDFDEDDDFDLEKIGL